MKEIAKVMKYQLIYLDGGGDFYELQQTLWDLQRQTREILNKTIQSMYLATATNTAFEENALYHRFGAEYPMMAALNVNATLRTAKKRYTSTIKETLRGTMSLPSYKRDQPILLHNQTIHLALEDGQYSALFSVYSEKFQKAHEGVARPRFALMARDGTQRAILDRLLDGSYRLGQSQMTYEQKKWFLSLTYKFVPEVRELDKSKILGVDLGCVYAIYASSMQQKGIFKISGDEITEFEKRQAAMQNREPVSTLERVEQLEQRRWQKQQQARYCGEGRVGHGTGTRVAPAYRDADKIARFRDTINHRYSKALVEYAEKNGFGTIQMEDLSGIKEDTGFPKRLRHWTYFDLQTKIQYKAAERGITVVKIDPQYTSQRCSRCGYIDKANRASQEKFLCQSCGFEANADYNASQNISVEKIDKLIAKDKKKLART